MKKNIENSNLISYLRVAYEQIQELNTFHNRNSTILYGSCQTFFEKQTIGSLQDLLYYLKHYVIILNFTRRWVTGQSKVKAQNFKLNMVTYVILVKHSGQYLKKTRINLTFFSTTLVTIFNSFYSKI